MSRIKGRDTSPELAVRSILHRLGFRFRLHSRNLIGKPDIVLPRYGTVVFVHGCFWHRHAKCRFATMPKTRKAFWLAKFAANVARDRQVKRQLARHGWRVVTVWACSLEKPERLVRFLRGTIQTDNVVPRASKILKR